MSTRTFRLWDRATNTIRTLSYEEWLRWRETGLGASDAPAVTNTSKWMDRAQLWALRTGRAVREPSNSQMRRGIALEPLARAEYERETGIKSEELLVTHASEPHLLASLDGINWVAGRALEIKCPGAKDHATAMAGRVPAHYVFQLVQILAVTDLPVCDYYSYDGHRGVRVVFKRDLKLERRLIQDSRSLWAHIQADTAPGALEATPIAKRVLGAGASIFKTRVSR